MTFTITPSSSTISHYTPRHATTALRLDMLLLPLTFLSFILGLSVAIQRSDNYVPSQIAQNPAYEQQINLPILPSYTYAAFQYVMVGVFLPTLSFVVNAVHVYISAARTLHPGYSLGISLVMFLGWAALACLSAMTLLWDTWDWAAVDRGIEISDGLYWANVTAIATVWVGWLLRVAVDARAVELMRRAKRTGGRAGSKGESEFELESRGMVSESSRPQTSYIATSGGARTEWSERSLDSGEGSQSGLAGAGPRMGSGYLNEKELPPYDM